MTDKRLKVFHSVALNQSFTKAAKDLNMTQPAVTFHIKQLEKTYKAKLFDRRNNKTLLTAIGAKMLEYVTEIFSIYSEMDIAISELSGREDDKICVATITEAGDYFLPALVAQFKRNTPNSSVKLTTSDTDEASKMLSMGQADVCICDEPLESDAYESKIISEEEMVVVLPADHELCNSETINLHQLISTPLILQDQGQTRNYLNKWLSDNSIKANFNISLELGSIEAIVYSVKNSVGVAILPKSTVAEEEKRGGLKTIALEPTFRKKIVIVYLRRSYKKNLIEKFVEFCISKISSDQNNEQSFGVAQDNAFAHDN